MSARIDTQVGRSAAKQQPAWLPEVAENPAKSGPGRRGFFGKYCRRDQRSQKKSPIPMKADLELDEHLLSLSEVCGRYQTSPHVGLLKVQAEGRLKRFGPNTMRPPFLELRWKKFLKKLFRRSAILLWASALLCFLSYVVQYASHENVAGDYVYLGIALIAAVFISGYLQYYQETKTQSLLDSFTRLIPSECLVWRNGCLTSVPTEALVIGDVVELRPGDKVPADLRIIVSNGLKVDNSNLTGESDPQICEVNCTNANPWETANLAFFPTVVTEGRGRGVVIRTGDNLIMGRIANLSDRLHRPASLIAKEIVKFVHLVSLISIIAALLMFAVTMLTGHTFLYSMVVLIGLLVANAPEGLLATIMICLSLTAKRMASKNCVVKHLEAVETLGFVSTICSDKTGTLTLNRLTVTNVWYDLNIVGVDTSEKNFASLRRDHATLSQLLRAVVLCNDGAFLSNQDHVAAEHRDAHGCPTDIALLRFGDVFLDGADRCRKNFTKVHEIPFNSCNMYMVSVHRNPNPEQSYFIVYFKGAPEIVLTMCDTVLIDGKDLELTDAHREIYNDACHQLASAGQRIIGVCDYHLSHEDYPPSYSFESSFQAPAFGYRLLGMVSLLDPLRPDVPSAVARCRHAGIQVIMITGDHPTTAVALAKSVGIITGDVTEGRPTFEDKKRANELMSAKGRVIHGKELSEMDNEELDFVVSHCNELVFVRTTPQQKLFIVQSCQRTGAIVAVTGDGVNDSPALKQANVGISMGIAGSEVSKRAADIILLDDNFVSIVYGIEEGLLIFENVKKAAAYTLTSNVSMLIPFIMFTLLKIPLPFGTVCVLCVDLGTDLWPACALAYEKAEMDMMTVEARRLRQKGMVNAKFIAFVYGIVGMVATCACFFSYFVVYAENGFRPQYLIGIRDKWDSQVAIVEDSYGQEWSYYQRKYLEFCGYTAYFISIVVIQWSTILIYKNRFKSVLTQAANKQLIVGVLFETFLSALLCYIPYVNSLLYLVGTKFHWWVLPISFAVYLFILDETRRFMVRKYPTGFFARETTF